MLRYIFRIFASDGILSADSGSSVQATVGHARSAVCLWMDGLDPCDPFEAAFLRWLFGNAGMAGRNPSGHVPLV